MKLTILTLYLTLIFLLFKETILYQATDISEDFEYEFNLTKPDQLDLGHYYEIFYYYLYLLVTGKEDLVLRFNKPRASTTKVAIYNNTELIEADETGVFINSIKDYDLDSKEVVITGKQREGVFDFELYIVFYDLKNEYADTFTLAIENSRQFMINNHCYNLYRFYSQGEMSYFSVSSSGYRFIVLNMAYFGNNSPSLEIRESDYKGTLIKEYKDLKRHEVIEIPGKIFSYFFIFKPKEGLETYEVYDLNFCCAFEKTNITEIFDGFDSKKVFTYERLFYFKFNLTSYNEFEENIAMLNLHPVDINPYDGFYCKYIQDEQMMSN